MSRTLPGRLVCVLTLAALTCGCATTLSPRQKRLLTTRVIDGSFDDTYRAALTVLADHGYTIRYTDRESGVITAYAFRGKGSVEGYELSCVLQPRADARTEVRFTIQAELQEVDRPWLLDLMDRKTPAVDDQKVYGALFTEMAVEVQRLAAVR